MTYEKSVCVYCGASNDVSDIYREGAKKLGKILAEENVRLVYGGGKMGLMGVVADSVMENGGHVLGIMTEHLNKSEVAHEHITELRIVETMHERKSIMFEESDGFVILPGGFGTLDELCEVITWKQIGLHSKPITLVDLEKYWSPLFDKFAQHMIDEKFVKAEHKNYYQILETIEDVRPFLDKLPPRIELEDHQKSQLI